MNRKVRAGALAGILVFAVLAAACAGARWTRQSGQYKGTPLSGAAADFTLADQRGTSTALSTFRGHVVVLTFLDTQCHDVCPQTAGQFRAAYRALGSQASSVAFLGVNVNIDANTQADVDAASATWQLTNIPTWHFLRGAPADLQGVWKAYGIAVLPSSSGGELIHSASVYVIDASGQKRWYISIPNDAGANQPPLNELIVEHVRELLSQ